MYFVFMRLFANHRRHRLPVNRWNSPALTDRARWPLLSLSLFPRATSAAVRMRMKPIPHFFKYCRLIVVRQRLARALVDDIASGFEHILPRRSRPADEMLQGGGR